MPSWDEAEAGRTQFASIKYVTSEDGRTRGPSIDLDSAWDDVTKLRWLAALVEADTGIRIYVHRYDWEDRETFSLNIGRHSLGDAPMGTCWTTLNGVQIGVNAYTQITE